MIGYIFETTNTKTGETYIGKRYAVSFDKNYLGEVDNDALAKAIEKDGRPAFSVKMLIPFEDMAKLDEAFAGMNKSSKPAKKAEKIEKVEEPEVVEEEKKPARKKKAVEEE